MKISMSVMAHPKRKEYFDYLQNALGGVPMSVDTGFGIWENCKRAWQMHDPLADFHVVIQDDGIICKDFKKRAEEFIEKHNQPNRAFNFYFGTRANFDKSVIANGINNGFIVLKRNTWGLAICLPVSEIKEMIEDCDKMKHVPQDDIRIGRYLAKKKFDVCYPMPCFIDHRLGESLVGDQGRFRKALKFIDHESHSNN